MTDPCTESQLDLVKFADPDDPTNTARYIRLLRPSLLFLSVLMDDREKLLNGGHGYTDPFTRECKQSEGYASLLSCVDPKQYDLLAIQMHDMINNVDANIDNVLDFLDDFVQNAKLNQAISKENFANLYKKKHG
jgi:hypothetical protein